MRGKQAIVQSTKPEALRIQKAIAWGHFPGAGTELMSQGCVVKEGPWTRYYYQSRSYVKAHNHFKLIISSGGNIKVKCRLHLCILNP